MRAEGPPVRLAQRPALPAQGCQTSGRSQQSHKELPGPEGDAHVAEIAQLVTGCMRPAAWPGLYTRSTQYNSQEMDTVPASALALVLARRALPMR